IKEKYESELAELRRVKDQFKQKSSEFDVERKKIDQELKTIIEENQKQSQKIQFIELKEKALSLLKANNITMSLEFANAALDIKESDPECLNIKGRILARLNQLPNALQVYRKSVEDNPENLPLKSNLVECLYFMNQIEEAESIISQNKDLFKSKLDGKLVEFFNIIKMYFESDLEGLKNIAKSYVQHDNLDELGKKMKGWDFTEASYFAYFLEENDLKTAIQNIIWYWDNQIKGRLLLTRLKLPLPVPPEATKPDCA
ncbi:MAG: tetratricopeptide repeat protein, partial [Desulfobacterales bacterium]|nr:tetratricopeptide repeat protein [Desulfobacterales bacterium]